MSRRLLCRTWRAPSTGIFRTSTRAMVTNPSASVPPSQPAAISLQTDGPSIRTRPPLPLDAVQLSHVRPNEPFARPINPLQSPREALRCLYALSKGKLTVWVCFSALPGYLIAAPAFSPAVLASLFVGTGLCASASQVTNQLIERHLDAKMKRTCRRPLVTGQVSVEQARVLQIGMLSSGMFVLSAGCNLLTSLTALSTYVCYVFGYTPLKPLSPYNTHLGAVAGALPVCLGFAAALGGATSPALGVQPDLLSLFAAQTDLLLHSPWLPHMAYFFGLQALWQMPHFYALAWLCREDYRNAGYKMFCIHDDTGAETSRICRPYMAALLAYPAFGVALGLTSSMWLLDATGATVAWLWYFRKFELKPSKVSCRRFFLASVAQLLALICCFSVHARGDGDLEPAWRRAAKRKMAEAFCAHEWLLKRGCSNNLTAKALCPLREARKLQENTA